MWCSATLIRNQTRKKILFWVCCLFVFVSIRCALLSRYLRSLSIITGRNKVVAKVMFLHVSVILLTGGEGGLRAGPPGRENTPDPPGPGRPPWEGEPPRTRQTPRQGEPPRDQADTPPGRKLQHTVNERPVRILLECILVSVCLVLSCSCHNIQLCQIFLGFSVVWG